MDSESGVKFCEKCNSYMRETKMGFVCTRCGHTVKADIVEVKSISQSPVSIDVVTETKAEPTKIDNPCPKCGNLEAFRELSVSSGEHAGVRQERSVERFTCAKCGHSWTQT